MNKCALILAGAAAHTYETGVVSKWASKSEDNPLAIELRIEFIKTSDAFKIHTKLLHMNADLDKGNFFQTYLQFKDMDTTVEYSPLNLDFMNLVCSLTFQNFKQPPQEIEFETSVSCGQQRLSEIKFF